MSLISWDKRTCRYGSYDSTELNTVQNNFSSWVTLRKSKIKSDVFEYGYLVDVLGNLNLLFEQRVNKKKISEANFVTLNK